MARRKTIKRGVNAGIKRLEKFHPKYPVMQAASAGAAEWHVYFPTGYEPVEVEDNWYTKKPFTAGKTVRLLKKFGVPKFDPNVGDSGSWYLEIDRDTAISFIEWCTKNYFQARGLGA